MISPTPHIRIPDACLYVAIERAARQAPDKVAIELIGIDRVTYRELMARADGVAAMLLRHGIKAGDRVALQTRNRSEILDVFLGCSRIGAIFVPFVDSLRGAILQGMVDLAGLAYFIAEESFREVVADVWKGPTLFIAEPAAGVAPPWAAEPLPAQWPPLPGVDELCLILYTSGTTGQSKGVMWASTTVLYMAESFVVMNGMGPDDVFHSALPATHGNALMLSVIDALLVGGTCALSRRFSASNFEAELVQSGATITNLLGSMSNLVLKQERSGLEVRTLKKAFVIPIAADVKKALEERYGCHVYSGYGLADAGLPVWTGPEYPEGSCGRMLDSWQGRVLDEAGREVPDGEGGELWVRSVHPFVSAQGYWNMPEATAARYKDRWIGTGDMFRRDANGWYYFMDRAKDTIRRRGENVSSQEVEAVILTHPEVMDCAVYAVPSEMSEDEIMVSVVTKPGTVIAALDLVKFLERKLPYFAVPRFVRFIPELPRTATQKVQKADLKKTAVTSDTWDLEKSGYKVAR